MAVMRYIAGTANDGIDTAPDPRYWGVSSRAKARELEEATQPYVAPLDAR
jgi:hypothetical protein